MLTDHSNARSESADVVVIGYGLAGAVSAITAYDQGAEVLILEKQLEASHHTNSSMSGGVILVPSDIDGACRYMESLCSAGTDLYWTDKEVIRAWCEGAHQIIEWMEQLGGKMELLATMGEHRDIPGADSIHLYWFPGMGLRMMRFINDQVKSRNIRVVYQTRAEKLITNKNREIVGVRVYQDIGDAAQTIMVNASRAVILSCGGFEYDENMKLNYLNVYPSYFTGSTANTGDGIRMALGVGADLWHMNCCSAGMVAKFADYPLAFLVELGGQGWLARVNQSPPDLEPAGYIVVDKHGRRFLNENVIGTKIHCCYYELGVFDSQRLEYPRVPSYWVFDDRRIQEGPLALLAAGASGPQQSYNWSKDNKEELNKGWIISADTIQELALKLGMEPDALRLAVQSYNVHCQNGYDPEFGREARDLMPLTTPPFHAVQLWPGGPNTQGGPKRNEKAQVLDTRGMPIPRLYAAGELGSIFGMLYPSGGGNLAECITFGRIAGRNAAHGQPHS